MVTAATEPEITADSLRTAYLKACRAMYDAHLLAPKKTADIYLIVATVLIEQEVTLLKVSMEVMGRKGGPETPEEYFAEGCINGALAAVTMLKNNGGFEGVLADARGTTARVDDIIRQLGGAIDPKFLKDIGIENIRCPQDAIRVMARIQEEIRKQEQK